MSDNAIETLQFNCTTCPSECLLTVEVERKADGSIAAVHSVTGNSCPRGDKFAHQELPLELHAQAMALIRGLVVNAPIHMGDIVLENLLDTNINLIASMDIDPA